MEIKAKLNKPYTDKQRMDFIVEYNHNNGFEIQETEETLLAVYNEPPAPTNEEIQQIRKQLFTEQADPIKYDYDEACAIYGISSSQALQLKLKWLEKKEEIRKNNPYKEI